MGVCKGCYTLKILLCFNVSTLIKTNNVNINSSKKQVYLTIISTTIILLPLSLINLCKRPYLGVNKIDALLYLMQINNYIIKNETNRTMYLYCFN